MNDEFWSTLSVIAALFTAFFLGVLVQGRSDRMAEEVGQVVVQVNFNEDDLSEKEMTDIETKVFDDLDNILEQAAIEHIESVGLSNKVSVIVDLN